MDVISYWRATTNEDDELQKSVWKTRGAMNPSHASALQSFARQLQWLLTLRLGVQFATVWFFIWGIVVLALRIAGAHDTFWLALGLLGVVPLIIFAGFSARKQTPSASKIRASYDRMNECGGIVMAAETLDARAWLEQLPGAVVPKFQWRSGRPLLLLAVSAVFAATALLLPERLTHFASKAPLEIGQIVEQLHAEVKTLAQEKIVDEKKSADLQNQLAQLQKDASGYDPSKTWEALDHIKQANADAAKQATEEAIKKTESLAEAQTLAQAMKQAAEMGMDPATAAQSAQALAAMLNMAKLEQGILNGQIPPELLQNLSGLEGLNKEQLEKLLKALEMNKAALTSAVSNLANLKMIDPAKLGQCKNAGQCANPGALAKYLSECQGGNCKSEVLFSWYVKRGRGGPGGGGPEAPMNFDNDTSEDNLKFQEHSLPQSSHLTDAQTVGVSKTAPELAKNDVAVESGALNNAQAGGGSGNAQVILPEHRQAVQRFFKRDEK